jgi:hypothetical protein
MKILSKLIEEITEYCETNNIEDIEAFMNKMLRNGFNIERYGEKPPWFQDNTKPPTINEEKKESLEIPDEKEPEITPEIEEEIPDKEEVKPETSKRYDIQININKPKKTDIYDEEDEPRRGRFGSNLLD